LLAMHYCFNRWQRHGIGVCPEPVPTT
jgi:hypothetical protein